MTAFDEFRNRDLVYDATEGLRELFSTEHVAAYIGFDPSAASLHVGSLLQIMALARLQRFGHSPIALVGGGTGLIGDPSGKSRERQLLPREEVESNVAALRQQLSRFLDFDARSNPARIVNNSEWLGKIDLLAFLRDVGKHFTVNYLLQKESINRRLESEGGISFTEFSYVLLQAYDFVQLFDRYECKLQIGGSDQWGNITAGIDLVRKLRAQRVHGLVMPLVTSASGEKFGKSQAGNIWLDARKTSPFRFYQFWLNTSDGDVVRYLTHLTFLDLEAVESLERSAAAAPEARETQRALAREVTTLVHGQEAARRAEHASLLLFGEDIATLPVEDVLAVFEDVPSNELSAASFEASGLAVVVLLVLPDVMLAPSKSEARRLLQSGGVYVNNRRVTEPQARLTRQMAIGGRLFVLRKGQRQNHLVRLV